MQIIGLEREYELEKKSLELPTLGQVRRDCHGTKARTKPTVRLDKGWRELG